MELEYFEIRIGEALYFTQNAAEASHGNNHHSQGSPLGASNHSKAFKSSHSLVIALSRSVATRLKKKESNSLKLFRVQGKIHRIVSLRKYYLLNI